PPGPDGASTDFQTLPGNYNGGFYVIDRNVLADLSARWTHWAHWLLDAALLPPDYAVHVDQVSFCMAVHDLGLGAATLDAGWNLPSHVETVGDDASPLVIHHHGQVDASLQLLPLQPPRHAGAIASANATIETFLQRHGIDPAASMP
ncbi:MAG: hypothetical protein ACKOZX_06580, partial [Gammaproteobacteria bacterium]